MKVLLKRTESGYVPVYESDIDRMKRIGVGTEVMADITKPRNYRFLKKFMALINLGFSNQDSIANFDHYRYVTEMKAGWFETIKTGKGVVYFPKSISFAKMEELEFAELYDKVVDVLCQELDLTKEVIADELEGFL